MVKHIVMWEFMPGKEKEAREFLDKLRGLYGQIEVLRSAEVAENAAPGNDCSAVLIVTSRFRRCVSLFASLVTRWITSFKS